jgi:hypothetical protein
MTTQTESTFYVDLWESLYNTGAKNLTVMIDACHSGSAIERAKLFSAYNERNVTIITSSSKDSSSWLDGVELGTGKIWTSGLYTWAWAKGFGNPEADYDSNGVVTEVEAHLWAMKLNPIKFGLPMDSLTKPQLHVHRAVVAPVAVDQPVVVPDADLEFTPKTSASLGLTLTVDLKNSIYGTYDYTPLDATVTDPSPYRIWDIKANGGLNYNYDLKFIYQPSLDLLPPSKPGYEPGVMTFDSTAITWKAHYPNVWDEIGRSIQAVGVTHFSPWVLAMVRLQSDDVALRAAGSVLLQSYPNPFVGRIAVSIETEQPDQVTIRVVDVTGRDAIEPFTVKLGTSKYTINLDGSKLSPGSYNLIVQGEHTMQRQLIVKE